MAKDSKIEWTDHTFNPWFGCSKVHEGCANCYAETLMDQRYGKVQWGPNGMRVKTSPANWREPLKWNRAAEKAGVRARVFCASLADVFEDWQGPILDSNGLRLMNEKHCGQPEHGNDCIVTSPLTLDGLRRDLFALIDATPWLDWLLLTKRPENIRRMWPGGGYVVDEHVPGEVPPFAQKFRQNVWLGTSISLQRHADTQIPELLKRRDLSPVLFLSIELMLGPINLNVVRDPNRFPGCAYFDVLRGRMIHEDDGNRWTREPHIDWVIVGGESGPHARPMHPAWARGIREQCQAAGVPFFFKQWGEWAPYEIVAGGDLGGLMRRGLVEQVRPVGEIDGHFRRGDVYMERVGKKAAGRSLDGREYSEFPEAR